jgi:hypothetical protein
MYFSLMASNPQFLEGCPALLPDIIAMETIVSHKDEIHKSESSVFTDFFFFEAPVPLLLHLTESYMCCPWEHKGKASQENCDC